MFVSDGINKNVSRVSDLDIRFFIEFLGTPRMPYLFLASACIMLIVHAVVPGDGKTTTSYMWTSSKPLECHVIDTYIIDKGLRSVVDCALKCLGDLYSCVGYVLLTTRDAAVKCEVCWIYDVSDNLISATNQSNITVYMPVECRREGGCNDLQGRLWIYVQHVNLASFWGRPVNLRATRKFTGQ